MDHVNGLWKCKKAQYKPINETIKLICYITEICLFNLEHEIAIYTVLIEFSSPNNDESVMARNLFLRPGL